MAKRYYWLKMQEDFFRDKRIKKLRKLAGGPTFIIIYQKLLLLSLANEGVLIFEGIEDTFSDELSLDIDEKSADIELTLHYLESTKLMESSEINNEYNLIQAQKLLGSEGSSAKRVRDHRERKKQEKLGFTPENEDEPKKIPNIKYDEVLEYLNVKTDKVNGPKNHLYGRGKKTDGLIKGRWEEGRKRKLTEDEILNSFHECIDNTYAFRKDRNEGTSNMKPEVIFNGDFWGRVSGATYIWHWDKKNNVQQSDSNISQAMKDKYKN